MSQLLHAVEVFQGQQSTEMAEEVECQSSLIAHLVLITSTFS